MTKEERVSYNSKRCSPNKLLEFRGAVAVPAKDRYGKDYTRIDLVFNENIDIKIFNPVISVRDKEIMATRLAFLCDALRLDFNDIPPCKGGWVEFVKEFCDLVRPRKYSMIYAKLTITEEGWIELGEGRCFSVRPDMEYTDSDTRFLEDVDVRYPDTHIEPEFLPDRELPIQKAVEPVVEVPKAPEEPPREKDWLDILDEQKAAQGDAIEEKPKKPAWVEEEVKAHAAKPKTRSRAKKTDTPQILVDPLLTYRQRHPEADEPPIDLPY